MIKTDISDFILVEDMNSGKSLFKDDKSDLVVVEDLSQS